jgi:hypothetical protein
MNSCTFDHVISNKLRLWQVTDLLLLFYPLKSYVLIYP